MELVEQGDDVFEFDIGAFDGDDRAFDVAGVARFHHVGWRRRIGREKTQRRRMYFKSIVDVVNASTDAVQTFDLGVDAASGGGGNSYG